MSKSFWIGAILLAGAFFWGVGYVVSPNSGDTEFQKMLEAMKQVKCFRGVYVGSAASTQHSERLWEVDCNRGILHKQSHEQTGANPVEMVDDEFLVGSDQKYTRNSDGSWEKTKYESKLYSASWYCDNLAQGTIRDLLPDVRAMLRSASIGKGDKKTVNGVRCQDWNFTMQSASTQGLKGSVCIGLEDHLPYEMTRDNGDRYSYTDYNRSLQFDAPEDILQAAGSTGGSN
ncbi:MAG TPA: hypothetical protein VEF05_00020 [Terriglobales bacterium]|nr:hypothetical protein [Terriglobales bacterium]